MLTTTKKMSNYILQMPVRDVIVTAIFGGQHNGLDLGWMDNNKNQPIYACDDGVVVSNFYTSQAGYVLVLQHDKLWTGYAHLKEKPKLKNGDKVTRGQQIGLMGNTGKSKTGKTYGNHLHLYVSERKAKYSFTNLRKYVIDPLPCLYCNKNITYKFSKKFTPKWYDFSDFPEPTSRDLSKHQVQINSRTRRLRKEATTKSEAYSEFCKRGIYNILEKQPDKEGHSYFWAKIKERYWVAVMKSDNEFLSYDQLNQNIDDLKQDITIYNSQKEELAKRLDKANSTIEDLKGDITIYKSQKEVLIDRLEKAISEIKGV